MKKLIALIFFISLAQIYSLEIVDYNQGFETDISGWDVFGGSYNATRVATGTNGILSKTGSYHGQSGTAATNWGGYNSVFPSNGYTTQVDVYLDLAAISADDKRFDFTSAINGSDGNHRRDFAFNCGGYTVGDGSFPTVPCFVISASNNTGRANSYPKNPGRNPIGLTSTGWYTFQHRFYNDAGVLKCEMKVISSSNVVMGSWILSNASDLIGNIGGNRYGWFAANEFPFLAIDNSIRTHTALQPTDVWVDDSWNSQGDVDLYNPSLIWQYNAFKTIQEGINAVAGSTVWVLPGHYYPPSTISITTPNLKLYGPQKDVDPRPSYGSMRTAGSAAEAIIDGNGTLNTIIEIKANNVEINGFEVYNGKAKLIYPDETASFSDAKVRYNIVHKSRAPGNGGNGGIHMKKMLNGIIEYNHVYDTRQSPISINTTSLNPVIRFNECHQTNADNAGIYVYDDVVPGMPAINALIEGNLVYDITGNDGIKLGSKASGHDANKSGGIIKNNIVHGTVQDGITVYTSNTTVEGNTVYGSTSSNGALYISFNVNNVTVKNNNIFNNSIVGIQVGKSGYQPTNVVVNYNAIVNNSGGGLNYNYLSGAYLNAEYNWWGACSGPSDPVGTKEMPENPLALVAEMLNTSPIPLGNSVSENVDYYPWLGSANMMNPVLWLSPFTVMGNNSIQIWPDLADCVNPNNAVMNILERRPAYTSNSPGMVNFGTALDPGGNGWGSSDVMEINYNGSITSAVTDIMIPTPVDKSLFIVFKPETDANNSRQVIFEAGETTSGFNVYTDNDFICFGMWNRLERMFLHTGLPSLGMGNYYLAQLEFNATANKFRAVVNGSVQSPELIFHGLTMDPDDSPWQPSAGIGGEVLGTRFHDYNIRTNNYSHTYNGGIGEVILYNRRLTSAELTQLYDYLNAIYGQGWVPPAQFYKQNGDWKVFSDVETNTTLSEAWPNPFTSKTSFSVMLPEKQYVRIELMNSYGELVQVLYDGVMDGGIVQDVTIDGANLPSGLYVYRVMANGFNQSGKVILTK